MVMARENTGPTSLEPTNSTLTQAEHAKTLPESADWVAHQDLLPTRSNTDFQESGYAHEVEEIICMAQGMVQLPPDGLALKDQLVQIERSLIEQALARTSGNVSQSARLLRLQRTTLIEKINKYELRIPG